MWLGMSAKENRELHNTAIEIRLYGWYYLGASSSPKLIKVVKLSDTKFWYQEIDNIAHSEGQPIQIQTEIGHDLIVMGNRTMAKQAAEARKHKEDWQQDYAAKLEAVLNTHDMTEEAKQDLDLRIAASEVYTTPDSEARQSHLEYFIEDAEREQEGGPDFWLDAKIERVHRQGKACTMYLGWLGEQVTFYPDTDYLWGEDRNEYDHSVEVYTTEPQAPTVINGLTAYAVTFAADKRVVRWTRFAANFEAAYLSAVRCIAHEYGPQAEIVSIAPTNV